MKYLLLLSLLIYSYTTMACNRRVDPKKAVLYVDTNATFMEIASAREAACARGETFVLIPETYEKSKAMGENLAASDALSRQSSRGNCWGEDVTKHKPGFDCAKIKANAKRLAAEFKLLRDSAKKVDAALLDRTIKSLADQNVAIQSMVLSGHDGSGTIHEASGEGLGSINKSDVFKSMKNHYGNKPNLLNEFRSVFLWGCYSTTPSEVTSWKVNLPNLKIIAGFNGSAPGSYTTTASRNILKDGLIKDRQITQKTTANAVKSMISSLADINITNTGIYVLADCGKDFYYMNNDKGNHFDEFSTVKTCEDPKVTEAYLNIINRYLSGEIEPPTETQTTELRRVYNFARNNSHCFVQSTHPLNSERVGLLLFWHSVKQNFGKVFEPMSLKASTEYLGMDKLIADQIKANEKSWWEENVSGSKSKDDRVSALLKLRKVQYSIRSITLPTMSNLKNMSRKSILAEIQKYHRLATAYEEAGKLVPAVKAKSQNFRKLYQQMNSYLYEINPSCMNFSTWHEWDPTRTVRPWCD